MRKILLAGGAAAALAAIPAAAKEGDVLVRARAIIVAPNERSNGVSGVAGSDLGVSNSVMPELDFTYMATDHIGAELILATTKHNVSGRGTIAGLGDVADTWVVPPTLTLQYHFAPDGAIRPYVGAGINYSTFYSTRSTPSLNGALGATKVRLKDSVGYALQAGADIPVGKRVFVNLDIKYIDMKTDARLTSGATVRSARVKIDPIVAGIGIGIRL